MHGAGSHLLSLERLAGALSRFRVVTMDQRWSGQSGDRGAYSWDLLVTDVEAVVAELGLGNPAIGGHSWGGMIAAFYGGKHPEAPAIFNLDGHGSGDPSLYEGMEPEEVEEKRALLESAGMASMPTEGDDAWKAEAVAFMRAMNLGMGVPEAEVDEFTERSFVADDDGVWRLRPSPALFEGLRGDQRMFDAYRAAASPLLIVLSSEPPPGFPEAMLGLWEAYMKGLRRAFVELSEERPSVSVVRLPEVTHLSIASTHATLVAATVEKFLAEVGYV
jgi:pimeloyl-ACP methyl ester carboxylesterase